MCSARKQQPRVNRWAVIHMTLAPSHTEEELGEAAYWSTAGCRQMPRSDRDTNHQPVCVCVWSVLSLGPFSKWLMTFPCRTRRHHGTKGHSGWNKDPLIVPLSKPLGQSAGGWWVPRVRQSYRLAEAWAAAPGRKLGKRRLCVSQCGRKMINGNTIIMKSNALLWKPHDYFYKPMRQTHARCVMRATCHLSSLKQCSGPYFPLRTACLFSYYYLIYIINI